MLTERAEPWIAGFVTKIVGCLPHHATYMRIDFVLSERDMPLLMEIKVIEPDLFLRHGETAYNLFAGLLTAS